MFSCPAKQVLAEHMKSAHPKPRDHKCHLCPYAANKAENLKRHVDAVHEKKKDFKCTRCNFETSRNHYLVAHNRSAHQVEEVAAAQALANLKKYKCPQHPMCKFTSTKKMNLKRHMKNVHMKACS
jgi:hypothetical protein